MLDFERCSRLKKDCEIFKCSVNIFSSSKSDVTVILLIMRPLAVTNLEPQSVCLALKSSAIIFCVVVLFASNPFMCHYRHVCDRVFNENSNAFTCSACCSRSYISLVSVWRPLQFHNITLKLSIFGY
uniref:Uncharacterized protein n=1 Tax=Vespula pensylvanica TaxID=30213 RepID=A0A834NC12_VESPE|nr:hypothetical protein H0235_015184 [Vespula pensylvanica]